MRGTAGAQHRLFGLICGLAVVLLAQVMASSASAADYIHRGQPIPHNVRWIGATAAGANTRVGASWTWNGVTTHHNVPVHVPSGTLGQAAKRVIGRGLPYVGWALTLRDLVNGAGWVIDELQGQVTLPGQGQSPLPTGVQVACVVGGGVTYCASSVGQLCSGIVGVRLGDSEGSTATGCNEAQTSVLTYFGGGSITTQTFSPPIPSSIVNVNPQTPSREVTLQELGDLLKGHPEIVNAVLIDPDTGAPLRTPELVAAMNGLRQALEAANGAQPSPDMPTDPDWSNPDTVTPDQSAWPGFCSWATTVCEFIDWVKAPDDAPERPEVPWDETPPEPVQWSSGLGGGQCPAPHQVTVTLGGYSASPTFEFTPLCTAATYLRPVLIGAATILAAVIVAGLRQNKDA